MTGKPVALPQVDCAAVGCDKCEDWACRCDCHDVLVEVPE